LIPIRTMSTISRELQARGLTISGNVSIRRVGIGRIVHRQTLQSNESWDGVIKAVNSGTRRVKMDIKPDKRMLSEAERQRFIRLREDLVEIDQWVREGIPGATLFAKKIMGKLKRLAGEK